MAALNIMRTMFVRIGFTNAATQVIVDEEQGIDVLEEIQLLTDNAIENRCKVRLYVNLGVSSRDRTPTIL
jgi:hypothetical protein